ncbi:MAG TPA: porin [Verrucomicrobiae bacterium]|nr:porin [Verrucomicrobiae bacterium]
MKILRSVLGTVLAMCVSQGVMAAEPPLATVPLKVKSGAESFPTKVETDGGLTVETMDGRASFEIEGRFQFDTLFFDGIYNDAAGGAWASDTRVRRMRLGVGGDLDPDWEWLFVLDINNDSGRATLDTGQITYKGFTLADLNIGRFKRPFLLDALTSSKWTSGLERSLIYDVTRSHVSDFSLMASKLYDVGTTGKLSWYAAVLNEGVEDYAGGQNAAGKDQYQFYARTAWAPWAGKGDVLHFGAAVGEINPANGSTIDIATRLGVSAAESHVLSYAVNGDRQGGVEGLYILGPLSLQSEYVLRQLGLIDGDKADLAGGYLQATWTLTGESRQYKPYPARPDSVVPDGDHSYGAIELVTRFDHIDLERPGLDSATADLFTVGANWYLNKHLHLKLNYLNVKGDNFGTSEAKGSAVTTRIAFQF